MADPKHTFLSLPSVRAFHSRPAQSPDDQKPPATRGKVSAYDGKSEFSEGRTRSATLCLVAGAPPILLSKIRPQAEWLTNTKTIDSPINMRDEYCTYNMKLTIRQAI